MRSVMNGSKTVLCRAELQWSYPNSQWQLSRSPPSPKQKPNHKVGLLLEGCLTMTYFRTGNLHYHRRAAVSRSCSRWEGVVPTGCGRQALSVGDRTAIACDVASVHRKGRSKA